MQALFENIVSRNKDIMSFSPSKIAKIRSYESTRQIIEDSYFHN